MTNNYATGGYVSGPKPGDPPLFPLDGCTYYWPLKPAPAPPGVTIHINTEPGSIYGDTSPTGYEQLLQQIGKMSPPEPIKLTREQLEQVRAVLGEATTTAPSLLSVPIEIVDRVEDSTPYQQRREKLKAAFEALMRVPYPRAELDDEIPMIPRIGDDA